MHFENDFVLREATIFYALIYEKYFPAHKKTYLSFLCAGNYFS